MMRGMAASRLIEIVDTTLRDGEQMQDVSYTPGEKLAIVKVLLDEVRVDHVELTSALVSAGERDAVREVMDLGRRPRPQWTRSRSWGSPTATAPSTGLPRLAAR